MSKFYFRPALPAQPVSAEPTSAVMVDPKAVELGFWESADKASTSTAYLAYLKKYPAGDFADLAQEKLAQATAKQDTEAQRDAFVREKAELERKAKEAVERAARAEERAEQERRTREAEEKARQAEERSRQAEEKAAKLREQPEPLKQLALPPGNSSSGDRTVFRLHGAVVTDTSTGLMWTRSANVAGKTMAWADALDYARSLTIGGYDNWRLPTRAELSAIAKRAGTEPAAFLSSVGFTDIEIDRYWTSSSSFNLTSDSVSMADGSVNSVMRESLYYVWAVRSSSGNGYLEVDRDVGR